MIGRRCRMGVGIALGRIDGTLGMLEIAALIAVWGMGFAYPY